MSLKYFIGSTYEYSNILFILLGKALEIKHGKSLVEILDEHIFKPLGLKNISYFPVSNYEFNNVIYGCTPTEYDNIFRKKGFGGLCMMRMHIY